MSSIVLQTAQRLLASSPLRRPRFRLFYIGSVATALGYTMQATIAAWLMATLTPSALMVALVQTASTTPSLLLGMVAGALADIVDRRRVLLVSQVLLLASTIVLGGAAALGWISPVALLMLTFLIGIGFTFYMPAQQAMINDLVPHAELSPAVALGAVAFNVSRAVGPALAGALAAWLTSGIALVLIALTFTVMLFALRYLRRAVPHTPGVPETVLSGIRSGMRYARHSHHQRAFIVRNVAFTICASALWALLPVIARDEFRMGAGGYGALLGCFGAGAVAAAFSLPRHLRRMSLNSVVNAGILLSAIASVLVASSAFLALAVLGIVCAGVAWVSVLASLSAGTQSSAPAWVRARALAMNLVSVQASMAIGSAMWGALASATGPRLTLGVAGGLAAVLLILTRHFRVELGTEKDLMSSVQVPELSLATEPLPDDGPVLIQIEYRVDEEQRVDFLHAIRAIGPTRRRNGASAWRLFRDLGEDGRFVERFVIASWAEYIRLRARLTRSDEELQAEVMRFQKAGTPLRVSRLIGVGLEGTEELD